MFHFYSKENKDNDHVQVEPLSHEPPGVKNTHMYSKLQKKKKRSQCENLLKLVS